MAVVYVDEAGVYLLPFLSRTWAPRGQTPLLKEAVDRAHLSVIAALSPSGHLIHHVRQTSFDGQAVVEFLEELTHHYRKTDLLVIWDGATIHRHKCVKEWVEQLGGRIEIVFQPAYSPEVNPVELVWNELKQCRLKNQVFVTLSDLQAAFKREIYDLQRRRKKLRQFFRKKSVAYY